MQESDAKNAILHIIDPRSRAVVAGDPDAIVANVAEDVVTFDVVATLVSKGRRAS